LTKKKKKIEKIESITFLHQAKKKKMKRVVDFQENDPANEAEWEFKDSKTENKKRKHNNNKKEKFNAKTKRLSHADFVQKKEEMLAFRKQLPIYSGIYKSTHLVFQDDLCVLQCRP